MHRTVSFLFVLFALTACNEATSAHDAGRSDAGELDSGATPDAGTLDASLHDGGPVGDAGPGATRIVVNEIRPTGDFVELYNTGSVTADLSNYRIADETTDDGGTGPSLGNVVTVPAGFTLAGGAYLVIEANVGATAMTGVVDNCLMGTVPHCLQASWGISNTRGDNVYLLPPVGNDTAIATGSIGPMAVTATQSWGRLPNGTGDFAANTPTPGAANMP